MIGIRAASLAVALVVAPPSSAGETPVVEPAAAPDTVVVMVPDLRDDELDEELVDAIEAQTAAGDVDVRIVRHNPATFTVRGLDERSRRTAAEWTAGRVLWVSIEDDGFELFAFEADSGRLLRRRVPTPLDERAAAVEDLANIASTVVAESSRAGMTEVAREELEPPKPKPEPEPQPEPKPEPAPKVAPEPAPAKWARMWLAVFYAGNTFADALKWQNAIGLSASWAPAPGAFVGVRYDFVFPTAIHANAVVFELRRHPIALVGGYRFTLSPRFDVQVGAKLHVDPVVRHAKDDASAALVTGDALRVFSGGGVGLGLGYKVRPQVRLAVDAGVDALFTRAEYGVGPGDPTIVLAPHPARFTLDVGMHFGLVWRAREED